MWIDVLVLTIGLIGFMFLVAVHELGHFSLAKLFRVLVYDFSVGMGRRLFRVRWGNTDYHLRALPVGGYVELHGEPGSGGMKYREKLRGWLRGRGISSVRPQLARQRRLRNRPWHQQLLVALAGPVASVLLGFLLFLGLNLVYGVAKEKLTDGVLVKEVIIGDPAQVAGIQAGDWVMKVNGHAVHSFSELTTELQLAGPSAQEIMVRRADETMALQIVPREFKDPRGLYPKLGIGVRLASSYEFERGAPLAAASDAFTRTHKMIVIQCRAIGSLVSGRIPLKGVGGPVSNLYVVSSSLYDSIPHFVAILAVVSVGLGVMNMLPLLPLDGGRVLFSLLHGLRGKPLPYKVQLACSIFGFGLLVSLMLFTVYQDTRTLHGFTG